VQQMLDYSVNWAEEHTPNPKSIYVRAGAVGGNGSFALPFGDIQAGIDAVISDGTVHVLAGTYTIGPLISVNKAGIQVAGEGNPKLVSRSDLPHMGIYGENVIISGLTFMREAPLNGIIRVGADNVTFMNNTVFNPEQDRISIGVYIDSNQKGVNFRNNTIYNMNRGIEMLADCTASFIRNNHIYNCSEMGILLRSGCTVTGNSWDPVGSNSVDIAIYSGNYDPNQLKAENHNASVEDDR